MSRIEAGIHQPSTLQRGESPRASLWNKLPGEKFYTPDQIKAQQGAMATLFSPQVDGSLFADAPFMRSSNTSPKRTEPTAYKKAQEHHRATGTERDLLLDKASLILTKKQPFTPDDVISFTETMLEVEGSYEIGKNEQVTGVPDKIPQTGVKEITLHRRETPEGTSVNIVYQAVPDTKVGDNDRRMPQQTRYVIGEDFSINDFNSQTVTVNVGAAERLLTDEQHATGLRPYVGFNGPEANGIPLDTQDEDSDKLRRKVCEDVFIAYLSKTELIEPSRDQADAVREGLQQGRIASELISIN